MSSGALRVAVIGFGQMGGLHANVLANLEGVSFVAVADASAERRSDATDILRVKTYEGWPDLLDHEQLDAVDVCLPDGLHRDAVVAAARKKVHVFLEKPLATNLDDAEAIVRECTAQGVQLMVGHLLRFDPRYVALKQAISTGRLGQITHIMAHRNSPWTEGPARYAQGTSLSLHVAVHDLDLINWYLGTKPVEVFARGVSRKLADKNMHDAATAIIEYEGGTLATLQFSWALPPTSVTKLDARLEVIGTEGMAIVGGYHGQGVFIADAAHQEAPDTHHTPLVGSRRTGDVAEELSAFCRALRSNEPVPMPPEDAFLAVREALAIEQSMSTSSVVSVF